jgi:hypothetical protein
MPEGPSACQRTIHGRSAKARQVEPNLAARWSSMLLFTVLRYDFTEVRTKAGEPHRLFASQLTWLFKFVQISELENELSERALLWLRVLIRVGWAPAGGAAHPARNQWRLRQGWKPLQCSAHVPPLPLVDVNRIAGTESTPEAVYWQIECTRANPLAGPQMCTIQKND